MEGVRAHVGFANAQGFFAEAGLGNEEVIERDSQLLRASAGERCVLNAKRGLAQRRRDAEAL